MCLAPVYFKVVQAGLHESADVQMCLEFMGEIATDECNMIGRQVCADHEFLFAACWDHSSFEALKLCELAAVMELTVKAVEGKIERCQVGDPQPRLKLRKFPTVNIMPRCASITRILIPACRRSTL